MFLVYAILYPSHPLTSVQNFTDLVPGKPLHQGLNATRVAEYSDVGHVEDYISETVQDTASSKWGCAKYRVATPAI